MRYSALTKRIAGDGAAAWQIHDRALELIEQGVDVLLLSIGDPDFDTPQPIVQACIDSLLAVTPTTRQYGAVGGCATALPTAIAVAVVKRWMPIM